jgi:MFS transporter, DHA1 family, inner membrane transport protein
VRHLDRDLRLTAVANLLFALGVGMYLQLLYVYAMHLGASRFTVGILNALMIVSWTAGLIPGAWAARRFRLKPVIIFVWWLTVPAGLCFFLAPSWPWLIPGLVLTGLYMINNPAWKSYIVLKSEPARVARNITLIFAMYPLGLIVAPLAGGFLAERYGMRLVFLLSTVLFVASSTTVSFIRDTPYHTADGPLSFGALRRNRRLHDYLVFFLLGYLAVYVGGAFLTPYLSQVHQQDYGQLGVYASLAALGAAVLTTAMGRATDRYGPRAGMAGVLVFLLAGTVLLLAGGSPVVWGVAMVCCGAYESLRLVAAGMVNDSFGDMPTAWGFAIFDTVMGLPMAAGAVLGGLLFRAGYSLPFVVVIVIALVLLALLAVQRRQGPVTVDAARRASQTEARDAPVTRV